MCVCAQIYSFVCMSDCPLRCMGVGQRQQSQGAGKKIPIQYQENFFTSGRAWHSTGQGPEQSGWAVFPGIKHDHLQRGFLAWIILIHTHVYTYTCTFTYRVLKYMEIDMCMYVGHSLFIFSMEKCDLTCWLVALLAGLFREKRKDLWDRTSKHTCSAVLFMQITPELSRVLGTGHPREKVWETCFRTIIYSQTREIMLQKRFPG